MRVVIVGAGATGSELARRLVTRHDVVLVEVAGHAVDQLDDLIADDGEEIDAPSSQGVRIVNADGTSRLQLARLFDPERPCALVAVGGSDEVNLEAVRFAREIGYDPILALQHEPSASEEYRKTRATLLPRPNILADYVERSIEHKGAIIPVGIGLGRGELVEIRLLGTSPIIQRSLKELAPDRWRIAAIFRDDELIVPMGDTMLKTDDRVLLVGDPDVLTTMAEHLRLGVPQFPQPYGPNVVTLELENANETMVGEAQYLSNACPPSKVIRGISGGTETVREVEARSTKAGEDSDIEEEPARVEFGPPDRKTITSLAARQGAGVVVASPTQRSWLSGLMGKRGADAKLCDQLESPVLFQRGTFPYRRILLPVSASLLATEAAGMAIDLTRRLGAALTAVNVDLPLYISGESEDEAHFEVIPIRRLCQLYDIPLEYRHRVGNPIKHILKEAKAHDLVVMARRKGRGDSSFGPDVAMWIARRAPCSVLVLTISQRA